LLRYSRKGKGGGLPEIGGKSKRGGSVCGGGGGGGLGGGGGGGSAFSLIGEKKFRPLACRHLRKDNYAKEKKRSTFPERVYYLLNSGL